MVHSGFLIDFNKLPKTLPIFPLEGVLLLPYGRLPLNIFEPRYLAMTDDALSTDRLIGIVQPTVSNSQKTPSPVFKTGCAGRITAFSETEDGRYLILLNGICRFRVIAEEKNEKLFRVCNISFEEYLEDLNKKNENINFSDLKFIFKELRSILKKQGYVINLEEMKKNNLNQTINTLSMASPFSLEEKQVLLETKNLKIRKEKLEEILKIYTSDNFSNSTLQ